MTLAHVARAHTLATGLDRARYQVRLACSTRYDALFDFTGLERIDLASLSSREFASALARGSPLYRDETLESYVREDVAVIEDFDPDLVVGDFRLSLGVSARLTGRTYLNVTNAGWSPYARPRFEVPDLAFVNRVTRSFAQRVFDVARPAIFALHAAPINRLRRTHGLPALARDVRCAYTDGDWTLYADLPELLPLDGPPETHDFLGPVLWSPHPPAPSWEHRVATDRAVAYVALGSSGRHEILPTIVEGLRESGFVAVVASPSYENPNRHPDVHVAPALDGDAWARRAAIVVCNGGSPTCYQALRHGVPVLGVPSNLDQYLNMAALADFGAGLLVRSTEAKPTSIGRAAVRLVAEAQFATRASELARSIVQTDPHERLDRACQRALAQSRSHPDLD